MKRIVLSSFAAFASTFPLATSALAGWHDNQSPIIGKGAISLVHNEPSKAKYQRDADKLVRTDTRLPEEVIVEDVIRLRPGEPRTYEFEESVSQIGAGVEGVVAITPFTDRTFTIQGVKPGQTVVMAQNAEGKIVRRLLVEVVFEEHLVRLYKLKSKDDPNKYDYDGYLCAETYCGRANAEQPLAAKGSEVEVEETTPTKDGGTITRRRQQYEAN